MPSPYSEEHDEHIQNYLQTGIKKIIGIRREVQGRHKDGTIFSIDLSISEVHVDGYRIFMGIVRDISERKRVDEALRQAHLENEQLLNAISSILIGVDADNVITTWNTLAEATFGIEAGEVVGSPFSECGIQWDWPTVSEWINDARKKTGGGRSEDIRFTNSRGKERILGFKLTRIGESNDGGGGFLLVGQDTTERKHLESQLAQAQKLESIGQLAAGIAHEINTPTQYVGDNTRFLKDSFEDLRGILKKASELRDATKANTVTPELMTELGHAVEQADLEYLMEDIPKAIDQSLDGLSRITAIVGSMKEFSG